MADIYRVDNPVISADGGQTIQKSVQDAFNKIVPQIRTALNTISQGENPIGPAGGDLSGTYPDPVVSAIHATSGTLNGVAIGGNDSSSGTFTNLSATSLSLNTALSVQNGGTGAVTLSDHGVLLGHGTGNISAISPGATGTILSSTGTTADPTYQTAASLGLLQGTFPINVNQGGTGATSILANSVVLGNGTTTIQTVAAGANGTLFSGTGSAPVFATKTALSIASSGVNTDITSLSSPSLSSATATTQPVATNNTTVATMAALTAANKIGLQSITASISGNNLTIALNPTVIDFYNSSISNGVAVTRTVPSQIQIVIPNGATLGASNSIRMRIAVLAIDNSGVIELAVVNSYGTFNFDDTNVITTTAISSSSNSANIIYSNSSRTGVSFRLIGIVDSTQATAGIYAIAPSLVRGFGCEYLYSLSTSGFAQKWQDVTGSRSLGTTYRNTTNKPISIIINAAAALLGGNMAVTVDGVSIHSVSGLALGALTNASIPNIPVGHSYIVSGSNLTINKWAELS